MHPRSILLLGTNVLTLVSALNPSCSPGAASVIAGVVSGLPEAQSYCSKNYPLAPKTATATAAPVTTTVATTTTTATVTGPASTTSITSTVTSTVTVTSTYTAQPGYATRKVKRESAPAPSPLCKRWDTTTTTTATTTKPPSTTTTTTTTTTKPPSTTTTITKPPSTTTTTTKSTTTTKTTTQNPWQSVLSKESSILGQICTCIETPQTKTVTTTSSVSVTATSTSTDTITPTSTATVTSTTTNTVTSTTTVTAVNTATCGPTVPARNQGECGSDEYCCDSSCNNLCTSPAYICYQACDPGQCANSTPGNPQTISYYGDGTCYATRQCSCPASRARRALEAGMHAQSQRSPTNADEGLVWRIHV